MALTRKKIHVSIQISNGAYLIGTMIIARDSRLSDVFNNLKKDFVVLTDLEGQAHIINKQHIIKITEEPDDDDDDYLELPEEE